jgi:hypothetical protein
MVGWTIQLKPVALIDHLQVVKEMGAAHTLKASGSAGGYLRVPSMISSLEVEVLYPA